MAEIVEPLVSLRRFSREATSITEPVIITSESVALGRFTPFAAPRSAQEPAPTIGGAAPTASSEAVGSPARARAPRSAGAQAKRDAVLRKVNRTGSER